MFAFVSCYLDILDNATLNGVGGSWAPCCRIHLVGRAPGSESKGIGHLWGEPLWYDAIFTGIWFRYGLFILKCNRHNILINTVWHITDFKIWHIKCNNLFPGGSLGSVLHILSLYTRIPLPNNKGSTVFTVILNSTNWHKQMLLLLEYKVDAGWLLVLTGLPETDQSLGVMSCNLSTCFSQKVGNEEISNIIPISQVLCCSALIAVKL